MNAWWVCAKKVFTHAEHALKNVYAGWVCAGSICWKRKMFEFSITVPKSMEAYGIKITIILEIENITLGGTFKYEYMNNWTSSWFEKYLDGRDIYIEYNDMQNTVAREVPWPEEYLGLRSSLAWGVPGPEEYLNLRSTLTWWVPWHEEYLDLMNTMKGGVPWPEKTLTLWVPWPEEYIDLWSVEYLQLRSTLTWGEP